MPAATSEKMNAAANCETANDTAPKSDQPMRKLMALVAHTIKIRSDIIVLQ